MRYHRKLHLIKYLSKKVRAIQLQQLLKAQQNLYASYFQQNALFPEPREATEQDISQDGAEEEGDEGFNIIDYIQSLPKNLALQFKKSNPQLPEIFFMSSKQKKKYFSKINNSFEQKLATIPQRKSKTKKITKFKDQFQIKPFNEKQKVVGISAAKEIYEQYQPDIHFS